MPDVGAKTYLAYLVTDLTNGKQYVGVTSQALEARWRQHRSHAERGHWGKLYAAMRKHGLENFTCEPIAAARSWDGICDAERTLIVQYDSQRRGYNNMAGGQSGPPRGHAPMPAAARAHLSRLFKGRTISAETIRRRRETHTRREKDGWTSPLRGRPQRPGFGAHLSARAGVGPVRYAGVEYPTPRAAAMVAGVTPDCFAKWIRRYGKDIPHRPKTVVVVDGARYTDRRAAAQAHGVTARTFRRWLKKGRASYA